MFVMTNGFQSSHVSCVSGVVQEQALNLASVPSGGIPYLIDLSVLVLILVYFFFLSSRPVDKRRAHKIQLKKRDDISDAEESRRRKRERGPLPRTPLATVETRKVTTTTVSSSASTPVPASVGGVAKKRKKRGKVGLLLENTGPC